MNVSKQTRQYYRDGIDRAVDTINRVPYRMVITPDITRNI